MRQALRTQTWRHWLLGTTVVLGAAGLAHVAAHAQFAALGGGPTVPVQRDQPVYYTADRAEYDRDGGLVTLGGHVEIWQNDRILRADRVTYNRATKVAAATGHVVLLDPDGQVLFSDYAELTGGLKDGIMKNLSAQLAENGHLAANGARRTEGKINELSRAIYTTCNVCARHPERSPLWDIRARSAVQDLEHKRIEYRDAVLDIYGVPVAYFPYFTHADPSVKRASGFLVPSAGSGSRLGVFAQIPYFWAIDPNQDATIIAVPASKSGGQADVVYRRRFNEGDVRVLGSVGVDKPIKGGSSPGGYLSTQGQFAIDDEYRWGFDINRASSARYLSDYKQADTGDLLSSQAYLEGFGQGSYSRLDAHVYQGLTTRYQTALIPYAVPRYEYSFFGQPDALGGRTSVDVMGFNVLRGAGTNTQRASIRGNWERPYNGALGDLWKLVFHVDAAAYQTHGLDREPSWGAVGGATSAQGMPTAAVELHWPFQHSGDWGTQVIEPIVQLIAAPQAPSYGFGHRANGTAFVNTTIPNEDSTDLEFTDANLFSLNRFAGIDRLEGGERASVALHGAWYFGGGQQLDGLVGQSYRVHNDPAFLSGTGLGGTVSDIVGHLSYTPNQYFDLTTRERFDHKTLQVQFADTVAMAGPGWLKASVGHFYSTHDISTYYDLPPTGVLPAVVRNEVSVGLSTSFLDHYRLSAFTRRDLRLDRAVSVGGTAAYEDECLILSGNFYQRYTSLAGDHGNTAVVFQVTFKTVGTFGFHAL